MMKLIETVILTVLGFVLATTALAQSPTQILAPGARDEYRFDYRGDATPIKITLGASTEPANVTVAIYTPTQIEALARGETPAPIGRGMPSREHTLFWSGGFKGAGVYRVVIENKFVLPITYRLEISGEGVSSVARLAPPATPPITSRLRYEGSQKILEVDLPRDVGASMLRLPMPAEPIPCTPPSRISPTITKSTKLCPKEIYPSLRVVGNNIGLFADDARTAIVTSNGRQFAITVEGSNNWIEGMTIQARADPKDLNAWLCMYDECIWATRPTPTTLRGGILYGGGILLKGSNSTVTGVTVRGGTIGIATVNGRGNNIIGNQLNDLNGWGSFNVGSVESYFVGNVLNRNNHGCITPDGNKYPSGCETAGWVCLGCTSNVIARNHCESSANCYYMSGERGLANNNKLVANYCAGAPHNCFEITFSRENLLQDNIATLDPNTGAPCKYPFWIGGSVVYSKNNTWECTIDANDAFEQARDSTTVGTNLIHLETYTVYPTVSAETYMKKPTTPTPAPSRTIWCCGRETEW
jgi:hypothetical protein